MHRYEIIRNRYNIFEQTECTKPRGISTLVPGILSRYCLLRRQNIENIAQDIFVRLWEKNNHFENYLALKSYLYLSARNSCLNYIKHHNIVLEHAQTQKTKETEENTWNTIVETEIISLLSDYIRQLPAECAKIMELVMLGYNSTEISTLTGASSSTVRSQKQRGIALLKKIVSPELYALFILFMQQTH